MARQPCPLQDHAASAGGFGPSNWYFSLNGNAAEPCNLVRARVACEASFIPTAANALDLYEANPVLRE